MAEDEVFRQQVGPYSQYVVRRDGYLVNVIRKGDEDVTVHVISGRESEALWVSVPAARLVLEALQAVLEGEDGAL